jgi:hypothetical protein
VSTDSLASCSPRALTLRWSIGSLPTGRRPPGRRARLPLNREPPLLGALAELTAPVVAINPDVAPTDVESLRRHGVEPVLRRWRRPLPVLEDPEQFNPVLVETLASFEP